MTDRHTTGPPAAPSWLLPVLTAVFLLSGVSALIYQVLWLRLLSLVFGVTVYAASTVLASFMAGLALGSLAAGRLADRVHRPLLWFAGAEGLIAITALATPVALGLVERFYVGLSGSLPESFRALTALRFAFSFAILIVPTMLMGATLPLIVKSSLARSDALGGAQAGEDLAGVDMVFTNPTPRRLAFALLHTFGWPWAEAFLWVPVHALAAAGGMVLLLRGRRTLLLLAAACGPYAVFHLVFQETVTTRYALPLVPAVVYLAVRGADLLHRRLLPLATAALAAAALAITVPAAMAASRPAIPVFDALSDIERRAADPSQAEGPRVLGAHQVHALALRAATLPVPALASPHRREAHEVSRYWQDGGGDPVWFLEDPRRTDLDLVDARSRRVLRTFGWRFSARQFMSGARPDVVNLVEIESPPAWFLGPGWHINPEIAALSDAAPRSEAIAYLRRRPEGALVFIGGRLAGGASGPAARVTCLLDGQVLDEFRVDAGGAFFREVEIPAGALDGPGGLVPLLVTYEADGGGMPQLRLTHFEARSSGEFAFILAEGWFTREYQPRTERSWRWTGERADAIVRHARGDVLFSISGESPRRYFDRPPRVVVRTGDEIVHEAYPDRDFVLAVRIPASQLARAGGRISLETEGSFVPDDRSGSGDRRRLGLRIYDVEIAPLD